MAESLGFEELINETFSHSDLMETATDAFLLQVIHFCFLANAILISVFVSKDTRGKN